MDSYAMFKFFIKKLGLISILTLLTVVSGSDIEDDACADPASSSASIELTYQSIMHDIALHETNIGRFKKNKLTLTQRGNQTDDGKYIASSGSTSPLSWEMVVMKVMNEDIKGMVVAPDIMAEPGPIYTSLMVV